MKNAEELQEFTKYLAAIGYSESTVKGIIQNVRTFVAWTKEQNIEAGMLRYNDITAYIQENKLRSITNISLQKIINNIKHYLNYLVKAEIIPGNPALALRMKNSKRKTIHYILTPEELEAIYKSYEAELPVKENAPPQTLNKLARKRNKVLLGLLVYQGLATDDIKHLELSHLHLKEGKITIAGRRRSNPRTLKLEPHQIFDLYDYVNDTRKAIMQGTGRESKQLFVSIGSSYNVQNLTQKLVQELRSKNPNLKNLDQVRASVITNWLKQHNTRKVQHMAGHRYVGSTEVYKAGDITNLQEDVNKYYPIE